MRASLDKSEFQNRLIARYPQLKGQIADFWGPLTAVQNDHAESPLQIYLTALLRLHSGDWYFARQVVDLPTMTLQPPTLLHAHEDDARRWLADR